MQVHVHDLLIRQRAVELCQQVADFRFVPAFVCAGAHRAAPSRHVGKGFLAVHSVLLPHRRCRIFIPEYRVARVPAQDHLSRIEVVQVVIFHHVIHRIAVRVQKIAAVQEIALHVAHILNAHRHFFAEGLQRRSVPCIQIDLPFTADKIRWEAHVIYKVSARCQNLLVFSRAERDKLHTVQPIRV